jgi:hypothetical protein
MCLRSVAYPGRFSRIPDPDFYTSRIPDLVSRIHKQQQKRGGGEFVALPFFAATNITKLKTIYVCTGKENFFCPFTLNCTTFHHKKCHLSIIWVWGPMSGKNLSRIHGLKKAPNPGSGSATLILTDEFIRLNVAGPFCNKVRFSFFPNWFRELIRSHIT